MSKYTKKVVFDYICGNDIVDYDVDELEDNYKFMGEVINYTGDKKMYNLCSDKVKKKYKFVKFMVNRFKGDLDFICNVADYYLENTKNELNRIELSLIMCKLIANRNYEYCSKYVALSEASYSIKRVEFEMVKDEISFDQKLLNDLGVGFVLAFEEFNTSDIVMNFFAQNFIDDIINDNHIDLEKMFHYDFETVEDLEKKGINNYLLDFLSLYDHYLVSYVSCHLEVLDIIKKRIEKIRKRWDSYNASLECEIYDTLLSSVHEYMNMYEFECSFNEFEILYYLGNELGILDKIFKYAPFIRDTHEILKLQRYIDKKCMKFNDLLHYNNLKKLMRDIVFQKNEMNENIDNKRDNMVRILKLDFKTGNILSN